MKIKILVLFKHERPTCVCLRSNRGCERQCEPCEADINQFTMLKECFSNKKGKP